MAEENVKKEEKGFFTEARIEILCAIFLGITAILTAWASWIGSLHGGNQATNYTKSNNLASEGNSMYNEGLQRYLSDMMAYNTMMEYLYDREIADMKGEKEEAALIDEKLEKYQVENCSEILQEGLDWYNEDESRYSPFDMPGIIDRYYEDAAAALEESRVVLEEGMQDNAHGDAYNLVNVIYSLVLFLLGIVGIFKKLPNRAAVLIIAVVAMILATIYMCTIPLPTGFSFANFF